LPEASFRMIGAWPQLKRATSKEFFRRTKALIVNEGMRDAAKDLIKSVRTVISKGKAGGPPLKPITVLLKGHALKLSATGRMANAFTAEKSGLLTWNVGIDSKAKYPDGTKVATVAGRHEFGANVPVTSAVRLELRNKGSIQNHWAHAALPPSRYSGTSQLSCTPRTGTPSSRTNRYPPDPL